MYYRLTYKQTADRKRKRDYVLCGRRPLHIGQEVECVLRLPDSKYEPQTYASILPMGDAQGWYIVRRTDCFDVAVNGTPLHVALPLKSGDEIALTDHSGTTRLKFEVQTDGDYDPATGIVYQKQKAGHRQWLAMMLLLILIAGGFCIYNALNKAFNPNEFEESVYHITTDSVYLVCDTIVDGQRFEVTKEAIRSSTSGTCFLTKEGLFVTARHCVEPWIVDVDWDGVTNSGTMSPIVKMATATETLNRTEGSQRYRLKAHCYIYRDTVKYEFFSTDFKMNKSRDLVLSLGTQQNPIYWRTIIPVASRQNMELGDFAYIESDGVKGNFELASAKELVAFDRLPDKSIHILGFPETDNSTEEHSVIDGKSQHIKFDKNNNVAGCIPMTALIDKGDSGGPVVAMIRKGLRSEFKVIGIVSKEDSKATKGIFWAVPVTEVVSLIEQGGEVKADTLIYRR